MHDSKPAAALTAAFVIAATLLTLPATAQQPTAGAPHPVVSTWSWQLFGGKCTETLQYRANGSMLSTSGEAVTEWTYTISAQASDKGFYKLAETSVRQNGKKDCSGDEIGQEGESHTRYLQFSPARDRFIVCQSESLAACFGPLVRVD